MFYQLRSLALLEFHPPTDDLMYDDSSRMNLEGYKTIFPTNIQQNATRLIG